MKSKVVIISLLVLFLVTIFLVFKIKNNSKEKFQNTECPFIAHGITKRECLDACNVKKRYGEKGCTEEICQEKCNSCKSIDCRWNKTSGRNSNSNKISPSKPKIKVYTGDSSAKITWINPVSVTPIKRIILITETEDENPRINFPAVVDNNFCEYTIYGLQNDKVYRISLYCENVYGISEVSNMLSIKPKEDKKIPVFSSKKNYELGIDDSIEKIEKGIKYEVRDKLLESIQYKKEEKDYNDVLVLLFNELKKQKDKTPLSELNIKLN